MPGSIIPGSPDGTTWVDLYTLTEEASVTVEISDTTAYTYYRFYSGDDMYCNVAEVVLYSSYSTGSSTGSNTGSNTGTVSPQTGFAFVGLGVVALASGAAIVVSKKRH
ncbi:MAG: hypothetical protein LUE25_02965 [Clostridiales bacterium]|nr:hypothetical protein [Clostridiales bacterium]